MKSLKYLTLILFTSCTVTRFTTLENFDKPKYETRDFDTTVTCVYYGNYDMISGDSNHFIFHADSLIGSQLKTKESFNIEPPFSVEVDAKMDFASLALYCPLWIMPVIDSGGRIVRELDIMELTDENIILSAHFGDNGYGKHEIKRKYIRNINPDEWHNYKVKVYNNRAVWYIDNKRRFCVREDWGGRDYYLWISIIMSTRYHNLSLKKEAKMDIKNLMTKKSTLKIIRK